MKLEIDNIDIGNIEQAINAGGKIWENPILSDFKAKIKEYYRHILDEQCCYCRKNTDGEFKLVLDIEHILPKNKFADLMFELYNLSVSCKRCNMLIKKDDIKFLAVFPIPNDGQNKSETYKIIHPNLDEYFKHLSLFSKTVNEKKIIKYTVVNKSQKGSFTYDFFKLSELEVNSFDTAQGVKERQEFSEIISPEISKKISELLKKNCA